MVRGCCTTRCDFERIATSSRGRGHSRRPPHAFVFTSSGFAHFHLPKPPGSIQTGVTADEEEQSRRQRPKIAPAPTPLSGVPGYGPCWHPWVLPGLAEPQSDAPQSHTSPAAGDVRCQGDERATLNPTEQNQGGGGRDEAMPLPSAPSRVLGLVGAASAPAGLLHTLPMGPKAAVAAPHVTPSCEK